MASTAAAAASPAPEGLTSEFASATGPLFDTTIGLRVAAVSMTTVFIIIRIITRRDMGQFETEDVMLILAYIFNLAKNGIFLALAERNLHENVTVIAQESYALELLYIIVLFCAKGAMLHQLRRTFAPWKSGAIYILYTGLLWFNVAFTITSGVGQITQCTPLPKVWDASIPGHCVDRGAAIIVSAVANLGSDVAIFLLPLWSIWHLKKKTASYRLTVAAVFGTAALAIGASIGRTVETVQLRHETADVTNHFAETGLWSCAETALLILCPCFLFMPRFIMILQGKPRPAPAHYEEASSPKQLVPRRWWFGRRRSAVAESESSSELADQKLSMSSEESRSPSEPDRCRCHHCPV